MKRRNDLTKKRRIWINNYVSQNQHKQMKVILSEISEIIFLSERRIYQILKEDIQDA